MSTRPARRHIYPRQTTREGQAVVEGAQHQERQRSAVAPFDGDGKFHSGKKMVAGQTVVIRHALGRTPRGWIVCRITGNATGGWLAEKHRDEKTINIKHYGSVDLIVDLWIF